MANEYQCPNCHMPRRFDVATKVGDQTTIEVTYQCESVLKIMYPANEFEWIWACKNKGFSNYDFKRRG